MGNHSNMHVTFDQSVTVHLIPTIPDRYHNKVWYTPQDMQKIQRDVYDTIQMIETLGHKSHTCRGLEDLIDRKQRYRNRRIAVETVLFEQFQQRLKKQQNKDTNTSSKNKRDDNNNNAITNNIAKKYSLRAQTAKLHKIASDTGLQDFQNIYGN